MNSRFLAVLGVLATVFCLGCPVPPPKPDSGTPDSGITTSTGPCTGGCAVNQVCDEKTHQCVDGCGGCDAGVCVKAASGQFQCVALVTTCNNTTCSAGQAACLAGSCSCLPFNRAGADSCGAEGTMCHEIYNPVTKTGGSCDSPRLYEACKTKDCPSGSCATCPAGHVCDESFGLCLRTCPNGSHGECNRDEFCDSQAAKCYPRSLFGDSCSQRFANPDGGSENVLGEVPVSNTCLVQSISGNEMVHESGDAGTGNCSYLILRWADRIYQSPVCRPPGTAALYGACKRDFSQGTVDQQCGTGLECAPTAGDQGFCFKMCNAAEPRLGFAPQPACGADEACVNLYRFEDPNAVAGVCLKKCDVFSLTKSSCADYGSAKASCVPVSPDGRAAVTTDGSGICIPQKPTVANAGESCAEVDPFKGASCAAGMVCAARSLSELPACEQPCDLDCTLSNPPARCSTEPNASCPSGKSCTRVTSTSGAILGFCR